MNIEHTMWTVNQPRHVLGAGAGQHRFRPQTRFGRHVHVAVGTMVHRWHTPAIWIIIWIKEIFIHFVSEQDKLFHRVFFRTMIRWPIDTIHAIHAKDSNEDTPRALLSTQIRLGYARTLVQPRSHKDICRARKAHWHWCNRRRTQASRAPRSPRGHPDRHVATRSNMYSEEKCAQHILRAG